jgi:hypothetical protein
MEKVILSNGVLVNQFRIIGTPIIVYEAFEPSSYTGNHSTIQRFNNAVYGAIASRRTGDRAENVNEAIQYILEAFPALENAEIKYDTFLGRIEVWEVLA